MKSIDQLNFDKEINLLKKARDKVNPELRKKIDERLNRLVIIEKAVDIVMHYYITQMKTAINIESKISALDNAIGLLDSLGDAWKKYLKILLREIIDNIKDALPAIAHLNIKEEILLIPEVQKAIEQTPSSFKNLNLQDLIDILQYTGDIKNQYLDVITEQVRSKGCVNTAITAIQVVKCPIFKAKIINIIYDNINIDLQPIYSQMKWMFLDGTSQVLGKKMHYTPFYHYFQYLSEKNKNDLLEDDIYQISSIRGCHIKVFPFCDSQQQDKIIDIYIDICKKDKKFTYSENYINFFNLCSDEQKMRIVSNLLQDIDKELLDRKAQYCKNDWLKMLEKIRGNGSFQEMINQSKGQNMSCGKQL